MKVDTRLRSAEPVPPGKSTVRFEFAYDGGGLGKGGVGTLLIDGKKVGEGRIEKTIPARFGIDTFGVGADTGSPVSNTYKSPFAFTGTIGKVVVDLTPMKKSDADAAAILELALAMKKAMSD